MEAIGNLDDGPERPWPYLWADFLEIVCLKSVDKVASRQSMRPALLGRDVSGEDSEAFGQLDPAEDQGASARSRIADDFEKILDDAFKHTSDRQCQYGDAYPFVVDARHRELQLKENLTVEHQLYIALLLAANHRYVPGKRHVLTIGFEVICWHALRALMPEGADVRLAGTTHGKAVMGIPSKSGKKPDKLRAMAGLLKTKPRIEDDDFWPNDTGDGGVDLLACVPFGEADEAEEIVFLGQCATSNDNWAEKQNDAAPSRWKPWLSLIAPNANFLFLAASPRRDGNRFEKGFFRIGDAVWLDRQRILRQLCAVAAVTGCPANKFMTPQVWELVQEAVGLVEPEPRKKAGHKAPAALT